VVKVVESKAGTARDRATAGEALAKHPLFIDNLLVPIHLTIKVTRRTGLAPWELEFPFPGRLDFRKSDNPLRAGGGEQGGDGAGPGHGGRGNGQAPLSHPRSQPVLSPLRDHSVCTLYNRHWSKGS